MFWKVFRLKKRTICGVAAAVLMFGVALVLPAIGQSEADAVSSNWGLSFRAEGQPPTGNASADALRQYDAYFMGNSAEKKLYLTFDAGYENGYTAGILDVLKQQQVPAAFFVVGHYLDTAPELIKRMVAEGHTVANHTLSHPDMSSISDKEAFRTELESLETKYKALTGKEMKPYYRPPQGKYSEQNLQMAHDMGYHTFFWSLAYVDWNTDNQPTAAYAFEKLLPRTHNGAIVLLHSTSATNAAILDELITKWKDAGYTFGTLDELCKST